MLCRNSNSNRIESPHNSNSSNNFNNNNHSSNNNSSNSSSNSNNSSFNSNSKWFHSRRPNARSSSQREVQQQQRCTSSTCSCRTLRPGWLPQRPAPTRRAYPASRLTVTTT